MLQKGYIFVLLLVHLCLCLGSVRADDASPSTENDFVITKYDDVKRQDLNLKVIARRMNKLEDMMLDIEVAIDNKLHKLERKIMETLRDYVDDKFDENAKTEKQDLRRYLKNISDTQDNLNKNTDQILFKMLDIENTNAENVRKLNILQNVSENSSQKLHLLMNTTNDSINVMRNSSQNIEKISKVTSNIVAKLNGLFNDTTQIESCPLDLMDNLNNESRAPIVWGECEQDVIRDVHALSYNYSKTLLPLGDKARRHVSFCTAGGRTEYVHMRVGIQASYRGDIVLSPEPVPKDNGFFFRIDLYHHDTYLGRSIAGVFKILAHVYTGTNLSESHPTAVLLTMYNDTLTLRHEYNSKPFFEYQDERFGDIKYFWFGSAFNNHHRSKFYYDC